MRSRVSLHLHRNMLLATSPLSSSAQADLTPKVLKEELELAMQLVGITSLDQAHPGLLNTADLDTLVYKGDEHPFAKKVVRTRARASKL